MKNPPKLSPSLILILLSLALIQFTHISDFVMMMPMAPHLMRIFGIGPSQFGFAVSAYTFSAGLSGLLAAFVIDRFDRKKVLLWMYAGFGISTLLCGFATTFSFLLIARILAGFFGGVAASTIFSIIGDVVPEALRGTATGIVMTSFSLASVLGVPVALMLSNHYGWHMPFLALAGICGLALVLSWISLPRITGHLTQVRATSIGKEMLYIVTHPNHVRSFLLTIGIMFSGFTLFPYLSSYLVSNVGYPEAKLPLIYFFGGLCTFVSMPIVGRLCDRFGKHKVLAVISIIAVAPILLITHLPVLPTWIVLTVTTLFMVIVSSRMIPAMALMTSATIPQYRGGFMSINSSVQQFAAGLAAFVAGQMIAMGPNGHMYHYGWVGYLSAVAALASIWVGMKVKVEQ